MAKFDLKLRALELRRSGVSIRQIAEQLGVSRSTSSIWCDGIALTSAQRANLIRKQIESGNKGRQIGAEMNKKKRLDNIIAQEAQAKKIVGKLSERDRFMLGIALYWGEGVKARGSTTAIVNSDPAMVLFARNWFEKLGVPRAMFRPTVFILDAHQDRELLITLYWSELLGMPKSQFAKIVFIKGRSKKVYENHDSYYGVLALRVRKGMTLKYRILGLIKACKS